ncbi:MAG: hypothetical protein Q8L86_08730 [Vicinamibacterales bacterium]|nr:hypothetical protein [Vicinamibacterales bacterium]
MGAIREGQITGFYLFDVAESVDLAALPALIGGATARAQLVAKPAIPAYVRYQQPPLQFDADPIGGDALAGARMRVKVYDYGIVSFALTLPFAGTWAEFDALARRIGGDPRLEHAAEEECRRLLARMGPAVRGPRAHFLSEDYFVFAVSALDPPSSADDMIEVHGEEILGMLSGEAGPMSRQEHDEVFRHRLSYLATDLVVPTWNNAFVYDTEAGLQGALELFEFANSQLLQFRYYDDRLEAELVESYAKLQAPSRWYEIWLGRRFTRAARHLHALLIDVTELTDRTDNALKLVGDVHAARLLALVSARLGVPAWRSAVQGKLKTLDDIYRFAVDQTGMDRGEVLEAAIVAILLFELMLFFMGIMT